MIRAMIVDDEPAAAIIIRHFIKTGTLPIEIIGECRNGEEAAEMIQKLEPGIVFLDIQMPRMNGFELMRILPNCNYIIITAYESFQYAQEALRLGAKDILLKPVELGALKNAITRAIGWKFTQNTLANEIIEYIHLHYAEQIEMNELAKQYYTTAGHIARTFKRFMGSGVVSYLHEVRIQNAVSMMRDTNMEIKEIAEACGYVNINNFYKYFKQATGMTPASFRKQQITPSNK